MSEPKAQPRTGARRADAATALRVARKEFRGFFASPAAYLFLGAFLAATLFAFFWVESFFARNIADARPLFQWLPLLLIFLVAALTMRSWSEERRAGTLESLLSAPVSPWDLILGKFLATLALVALALTLTLPLPVTVALLGPLDWGPVVGGYIATLFVAAAYAAIGLYMSGRTDNPIVALILTTLVCGAFYLIGAELVTGLVGYEGGRLLGLLGTGSRFESITRGVLDLRDLYYYVSIVGVFLLLNRYSLERARWAGNPARPAHRLWGGLVALGAANFIAANLWLAPITWARVDLTQGHLYTLSDATRRELAQLREPLIIRGYFSAHTHPLLAPLVPRLRDLLEEYAVASRGRVRVEILDPQRNASVEEEAATKYGVRPVPFQMASRYQASVVNSYFDIVVSYGDQYETMGFRDLIEAKAHGERELEVVLKNPEYSITRAIRKVVNGYQAGGNPFETLAEPVHFRAYLSPDEHLPQPLRALHADLDDVLADLKKQGGTRFTVEFADPDAGDGALARELRQRYGFQPQVASLYDPTPFWFYLTLETKGEAVQVPLPQGLSKDALRRSLVAALQRLSPGFLKTIALFAGSPSDPSGPRYSQLEDVLAKNLRVESTDLHDGQVPSQADLLLVLAPQSLDDKQRFAIDQFLMQGGTVVLATSGFDIQAAQTLSAQRTSSGLKDWLAHNGLSVEDSMVLDTHCAALPVPVMRDLGGVTIREIRMLPYPHFPDLRGDQLSADNPATASLGQLTLNWVSPIAVDKDKNKDRKVSVLLQSSPDSWTSSSLQLVPDYRTYPDTGFAISGERKARPLAVAVEGRFDSFFAGRASPLAESAAADKSAAKGAARAGDQPLRPAKASPGAAEQGHPPPAAVIERSPETARLILVGSNTFASDVALGLVSEGLNTLYTKPVELVQNIIDWSLDDPALLALRGRTQLARTLAPLSENAPRIWEYANYALALAGLLAVWAWRRQVARADRARYQRLLAEV